MTPIKPLTEEELAEAGKWVYEFEAGYAVLGRLLAAYEASQARVAELERELDTLRDSLDKPWYDVKRAESRAARLEAALREVTAWFDMHSWDEEDRAAWTAAREALKEKP